MEISEVRVKLVNNLKERLKAFCSITLENDFVIRDLKIIDGANGTFVAMPSRKLADRCSSCGCKNHLRAHYCNECGKPLGENRTKRAAKRGKLHADIAHPINAACRERIQGIVIDAYHSEVEKSKQPDYKPVEMDVDLDSFEDHYDVEEPVTASSAAPSRLQGPPPRGQQPRSEDDANAGGYDDLIADLKRDAAARRDLGGPAGPKARGDEHGADQFVVSRKPARDEAAPAKVAVKTQDETASDEFDAGIP